MKNSKSLNLAVIFDQILHDGGGFQQGINAALLTNEIPNNLASVTFFTQHKENVEILNKIGINVVLFSLNIFNRVERFLRQKIDNHYILGIWKFLIGNSKFEDVMVENKIDLVYFLAPTLLFKDLDNINFIATVWDLCHRDFPEFPEIRKNNTFESREAMYSQMLSKSFAVVVDSDYGKNNVIRRYLIDERRVIVSPFKPAIKCLISKEQYELNFFDVKKNHNISLPYIFYPAQFWPHKNHIYIIEGVKILEDKFNIKINVIFSGSDKGNLAYLKSVIDKFELSDRVIFAGFIEDELVPYYYKQSLALVMPTYFGPTNIPPLEAFVLEVPVLYSDLPGLKDQVGDAALLMNLNKPESMAKHIFELMENSNTSEILITNGLRFMSNYLKNNNAVFEFNDLLTDFLNIRKCWS
jgi:glycosyltransferase involved in cell wall biosynthesis